MSLASGISLKPRPLFACVTQSLSLTAVATPQTQTFQPTFANGVLTQVAGTPVTITQSSLTQLSVAEWNALKIQNFYLKGINTGTPTPEPAVVYELVSFTANAPVLGVVQPSTLTYYATSITGAISTPSVVIVADV